MPDRCEIVLERCAQLGWVAKAERTAGFSRAMRIPSASRTSIAPFVLDPDLTGERLAEHWKHIDASLGASLRQLSAKETAT
jgi:hypothetical protein